MPSIWTVGLGLAQKLIFLGNIAAGTRDYCFAEFLGRWLPPSRAVTEAEVLLLAADPVVSQPTQSWIRVPHVAPPHL